MRDALIGVAKTERAFLTQRGGTRRISSAPSAVIQSGERECIAINLADE